MMDGELFTKLEALARILKNSRKPFGGIQLVRAHPDNACGLLNVSGAVSMNLRTIARILRKLCRPIGGIQLLATCILHIHKARGDDPHPEEFQKAFGVLQVVCSGSDSGSD
jgi:hypothetical protein